MRLTVLGCHSPYPGPGGATPGYLVETEQVRLLLDCGSGVISQLTRRAPVHALDALVLSHYHHDHAADVGVLQYGLMVHQQSGDRPKEAPLPVYAPGEPPEQAGRMSYKTATRHVPIDESSEVQVGDVRLTFLRTDHPVSCYAVKLCAGGKTLVYGADSGLNTRWLPFAAGADLFLCEGTYLSRNRPAEPNGHLSVREAAETAQRIGAKALIVTHLFPAYTREEVLREAAPYTAGPCRVAEVGLSVEL